jgi:hypothetical protein
MSGTTAFVGTTGPPAHVADKPVYVAPASHVFEVAPSGHTSIAPPGRVQVSEASSGKGISIDANS